ncbi:MAG: chromosomal replication initiator protein DnaA [Clostridia bacterium]|nr:chromosomal replication initiator protein DnaA [Clostridia bacterium]
MQSSIEKLWQQCLEDFGKNISSVGMDLWINTLQPINLETDKLVVVAPNEMARNQVYDTYFSKMKDSIKRHYNVSEISVLIPEEKEEYISKYSEQHPNDEIEIDGITTSYSAKNPFNPRYTFDNFVIGTTNQVIYAAARAVAECPAVRFNPLFIYGGSGLGKTHLLQAIGNYLWEHKTPNFNIVYVTCEQFTNDFVDALRERQEKGMEAFHKIYREADVLIIDDIQSISNKKGVQEEFFNTFNDLYQSGKQIIISSDRPPKEMSTLEDRLRSRFASGFIQDIQPPDFETRLLIIQKKIELEGFAFDKGVDSVLADRLANYNIREIEGILKKIYFLANLHGKASASVEDMEEVLRKDSPSAEVSKSRMNQDKIIDIVCDYYGINRNDLTGRRRNKEIVMPRQVCIYLMWSQLNIPLINIGEYFGRDHTTIIHARDKIMDMLKTDKPTKKTINELVNKIKMASL